MDTNYRLQEFKDLMEYHGGYVKFDFLRYGYIRFKLTPHSPVEKIYEVRSTDDFSKYGEARDAIIQTLMYLKAVKEGKINPPDL